MPSIVERGHSRNSRNVVLLSEMEGPQACSLDSASRDARRRMTAKKQEEKDLSNTQQLVYLSSGADISGFKMKAIATRMRHKLQRQKSVLSNEGKNSFDIVGGHVEEGNGDDTAVQLSTSMLRMIALKSIIIHPFSSLLIAFPLGIWAELGNWGTLWSFWLNIIAMIPLAKILGDATEELADAIQNDTISGLLNATLGNAVEMIITVQTLRKGMIRVVKATLLGSILSNLLLVLGTSFLLGGFSASSHLVGRFHIIHTTIDSRRDSADRFSMETSHTDTVKALADNRIAGCITMEKEQLFTVKGALVNISMHLLSIMTVALPTILGTFKGANDQVALHLSRCGALVITSSYIAYIVFHLVTHKEMLSKEERCIADDDDDDKQPTLGAAGAISLMLIVTAMIEVSSEFLVQSMGDVVQQAKLPSEFIGVILLPIAGNACEHASAVRFAMIDRPGLTIGIAMGSATQISLLVVPFAVIVGWLLDEPMDLNFGVQDLTILFLSTLVVLALVLDGRSNWLKGFLLCNAYIFIGLLYWFVP